MGRSVLLYQGGQNNNNTNNHNNNNNNNNSGLSQTNSFNDNNNQNDSSTILNMDLIQKQQLQKRLIINEEETFLSLLSIDCLDKVGT